MQDFKIHVEERWVATYLVRARDPGDAKEKVITGAATGVILLDRQRADDPTIWDTVCQPIISDTIEVCPD